MQKKGLFATGHWLAISAVWTMAALGLMAVAIPAYRAGQHLGEPEIVTGYSLFGVIVLLLAFNLRKRITMLPLGRAHWWTLVHSVAGLLAVVFYFLHTGTLWPQGLYEQFLATLFYLATASGIFGYFIQRLYPHRLTGRGTEVLFERIPGAIADLREDAEALVLTCTRETRSDTLVRYYVETFDWFFRSPRFLLSHLTGAHRSEFWLTQQHSKSAQYLNEQERGFLNELLTIARRKDAIDFHYAAQSLMKGWLLVHVPAVVALSAVVLWHLLLVNIYGL